MATKFPKTFGEDLNGNDNVSGFKQRVFIARKDWFDTIAKPENDLNSSTFDPLTNFEGTVQITDSHTFKVGFGFLDIYCTFDVGDYDSEMPPGNDHNGSYHTVKFFIPGIDAKKLALVRNAQNYKWIVIIETIDGKFMQIGTEHLWADIIGKFKLPNPSGDRRGSEMQAKAFQIHPILYSGELTPHP